MAVPQSATLTQSFDLQKDIEIQLLLSENLALKEQLAAKPTRRALLRPNAASLSEAGNASPSESTPRRPRADAAVASSGSPNAKRLWNSWRAAVDETPVASSDEPMAKRVRSRRRGTGEENTAVERDDPNSKRVRLKANLKPRSAVTRQINRHIAFVIDKSGSMRKTDVDGASSRMDAVFQAVADFLDSAVLSAEDGSDDLAIESVYSLAFFNDYCDVAFQGYPLADARVNLNESWKKTWPSGGTKFGQGLQALAEVIDAVNSNKAIASDLVHHAVFLSDGKPGDHRAERDLRDLQGRIPAGALELNTVGFGPETEIVTKGGLKHLADLGNGTFFNNTGMPAEFCKQEPEDYESLSDARRKWRARQAERQALASEGSVQDRAHEQVAVPTAGAQETSVTLLPRGTSVCSNASDGFPASSGFQSVAATVKPTLLSAAHVSGTATHASKPTLLSAAHLSKTFTALATSIMTKARTSVMNSSRKNVAYPAPTQAWLERMQIDGTEVWEALRWVERKGVFKVSGAGDIDGICVVDNAEVLRTASDSSLCPRQVRVCNTPFARGSMRDAYQLWDRTGVCATLVAKQPRLSKKQPGDVAKLEPSVNVTLQVNREFLEMHGHATECAAKFNKALRRTCGEPLPEVRFVDAFVYCLLSSDRQIKRCFNAEEYLSGLYEKFNSNNGYVNPSSELPNELAQAFTHFSYEYSMFRSLVADIQGVGCAWTDPQMHCASEAGRYGCGDFGPKGISDFFASHTCNRYCSRLCLRKRDVLEKLNLLSGNEVVISDADL